MEPSLALAVCPFGPDLERYWALRHDLFSRFDEGIQTDAEGLYSAKPEAVALQIGKTLQGDTVLDAFCGVGSSAIGFARAGKRVIAVDSHAARLQMARHNASIYGVAERVTFLCQDALRAIAQCHYDAVFLDPPWGGPDYIKKKRFSLMDFAPDGLALLTAAFEKTDRVALTVPRNFDVREAEALGRRFQTQEHQAPHGDLLFLTLYFGHGILNSGS